MALDIPGLDAQATLQAPDTPTTRFHSADGMQAAGSALERVAVSMQDNMDKAAYAGARVDFQRGLYEIDQKYAQDTDFDTAEDRRNQDVAALKAKVLDGLSGRVSASVTPWMQEAELQAEAGFTAANMKRRNAKVRAEGAERMDYLGNAIVYADTPEARAQAVQNADLFIESQRPFYEPEAFERMRDTFEDNVIFQGEKRRLNDSGGQGFEPVMSLSPEKNAQLGAFAEQRRKEVIAEYERQEKATDKAVKERQDAYELEVLSRMDDGNYTLADWEEDRRRRRLGPEGARRVHKMITGKDGAGSISPVDNKQYSMATGLLSQAFRQGSGPTDKFDYGRQRRYELALDRVQRTFDGSGFSGKAALDQARREAQHERIRPLGYEGEMTVQALQKELAWAAISYNTQLDLKKQKVEAITAAIQYLESENAE